MAANDIISTLKSQGFFIYVILLELAFVVLSLISVSPLIRVVFVFPCLFIIPGLMLLVVLGGSTNTSLVELSVKGFFISTIILVFSTTIFLFLSIPLIPLTYSMTSFGLVITLTCTSLIRKREVQFNKSSFSFVCIALLSYILVLLFFSLLPRLFAPDETSYISSALTGIFDGVIPPIGIRPDRAGLIALLQGRYFWIYLLCSFIGSTGLVGYQAGFLSVSFLIMTALASSLLVKDKWLSSAVFVIVVITPSLFYFSSLALNDLAIAFYAVFAVLFFVRSFSKTESTTSISFTNIIFSALGLVVLTIIKLNILVLVALWVILIVVFLRYRLYRKEPRYKILFTAALLPVLLYELVIDIPYVVSVWFLQNDVLGGIFARFLFVSPVEQIVGWFLAPPWNPSATTIFSHGINSLLDYFYCLLNPESLSLVISAVIVAMPLLLFLSQDFRKEFPQILLSGMLLLSIILFYFHALASTYLSDINRLLLWVTPLSIPLALLILDNIVKEPSLRNLLPVFLGGLLLFLVNLLLTIITVGGVWIGFGFPFRLWTILVTTLQLAALSAILTSLALFKRKNCTKVNISIGKLVTKQTNPKKICTIALISLILVNGVYYHSVYLRYSMLYEDYGFIAMNSALVEHTDSNNLIFANNYIYMRPHISGDIFQKGLLLPPPDTLHDLDRLLETAPANTLFLISDNDKTTWYEYANDFIRPFAYADALTPSPLNVSKLPSLSTPVLVMTFDDANETMVPDSSGYGNNGDNYGATLITGYQGQALEFDGRTQHVTVRASESLNIQNEITISFFAKIEETSFFDNGSIIAKGIASTNGSYDVYVWDNQIRFSLGGVGDITFPIESYINSWHHFLFTYNGQKMELYLDGFLVAAKLANGIIRTSPFDLEIGRTIPTCCYFNGCVDNLLIANSYANRTTFIDTSTHYAPRIHTISLPQGQANLFQVRNVTANTGQNLTVHSSQINIQGDRSVTIELGLDSHYFENVTILISTDRFTKVYVTPVVPGQNNIEFIFPYNASGLYWPYLSQVRLVIIDGYRLVFNDSLLIQDAGSINLMLSLTLLVVIVLFLSVHYWKSNQGVKGLKNLLLRLRPTH